MALARLAEAALAVERGSACSSSLQRRQRFVAVARREEDLDELLRELLAQRRVDVAVENDDAAVRVTGSEASALS